MNILEARRRTLGGHILKKTAQGNPAVAQGSLARRGPGITMQGWTEQDGTPTPEAPVPIVSAGTKNQETGKWDYEITITNAQTDPDKNQTVTLTADRPLTKWDRLEKRNGQWGWVYKSNRIEMDGSETGFNENYLPILILGIVPTGVSTDRGSSVKPRYDIWSNYTDILVWSNSSCNECSINLDNSGFSTIGVNSADTFKQWLAQKYSEGNSFYYEYETAEETFVPLTTAEQEAMNALHTYRPTTVLTNQQDCQMTLTYKTRKSMEVTA